MAKVSLVGGATSYIATVFIQDSSSALGIGKTGLVFNTASLTAYYVRPGSASAAITLATQTTTGAFSSGGFVEIDATNMPGFYRLDIPDAALAAGVKSVAIMLKGAANMAPCPLEIELTAWNNQDAVRGGMTALPNAVAGANGGLPLGDASGRVDLSKLLGGTIPAPNVTGVPLVDLKYTLGTISPAAAGSVRAELTAGQLFVKKGVGFTLTFPMTNSTTHTPSTGLTVSSKRTIDGAALASTTNSVTEVGDGLYALVISNADVNGTNITFEFTAAATDTKFVGVITQP